MKPDEFRRLTLGDYQRIKLGYELKEHKNVHKYRNVLAAILREKPRKIFELPGDYDHIPDPMTQDEMIAQANKLGYAHLLGIGEN